MQCDSLSLLSPPDTTDSTRYKPLAQAGLIRMFGPGSWKQRGPLCWSAPALSHLCYDLNYMGVPGSSAGKESACNAGDPGSILGSGRSPGEGICYPLQYSWASVVAQIPGWEDPLEEGMAMHPSILAWRIPWTEEPGGLQSMGVSRVRHD